MESNETRARGHRKTRIGYVESDKMDKTIVVAITRRFRHPKYKKFVKDPGEVVAVGDIVKVKVVGVEPERRRIALSRKQLL